jgi:hypothetical protein
MVKKYKFQNFYTREETLYTEEQVRKAIEMTQDHHETEFIIQSLKQPKKD